MQADVGTESNEEGWEEKSLFGRVDEGEDEGEDEVEDE